MHRLLTVLLLTTLLCSSNSSAKESGRTVTGRGVRFWTPISAERGKFVPAEEGQWRYRVKTNVKGLGALTVMVEARGDPEANLSNELIGVEANARSVHMKRSHAHVVDVNRSRGGEALESVGGKQIVHLITWSAKRQFTLSLESTGGVDPMRHPVWKSLVSSFRSDEAPLK